MVDTPYEAITPLSWRSRPIASTVSWVSIEGLRMSAPPAHHPGEERPNEPDLRTRVGRLENLLLDMYDLLAEHGLAFTESESRGDATDDASTRDATPSGRTRP